MRPELGLYIARIATGWTRVEERVGYLITQLLGAHAHTGMRMYQALASSAAQLSVLRAVARERLSPEMQEEMESILADMKRAGKGRNKVVHGHWFFADNLPDDLVWCDSADSLISHGEFWAGYNSRAPEDRMDWLRSHYPSGGGPRYLLYNKQDFEDVLEGMRAVLFRLTNFVADCQLLDEPPSDEIGVGRR